MEIILSELRVMLEYLLKYCSGHKECKKCQDTEACEILTQQIVNDSIDTNQKDRIIQLIKYCGKYRLCQRCERKIPCLLLEREITREKECEKIKEIELE